MPAESACAPEAPEKTARVFFALWPDALLAERLAGIAQTAARQFGGRPTRAETVHLTLAFLGEVPEAALPQLIDAARRVRSPAFELTLDHLGVWRHNRLLWAGCQAVPPALTGLVGTLRESLAGTDFVADGGPGRFLPHVTLVRKIPAVRLPGREAPFPAVGRLPWVARRFVLARSRLSPNGSSYDLVAGFPLED